MAAHVDINLLCVSSSEQKATAKGVTFVRVVVKGIGPGRLVSRRKKICNCFFCELLPCDPITVYT